MLIGLQALSADHDSQATGESASLQVNLPAAFAGRVELGGAGPVRVTAAIQAGFLADVTGFHNADIVAFMLT